MALHALSDSGTATTGWTHGRHEDNIFNFLHEKLLPFIPAFMVKPLTDKLNWRLGSIFFSLRHVQVIDKNDEFLARRRAENTLSAFLELFI
jgi:hypothetical protein